jgi:hypothetical protein
VLKWRLDLHYKKKGIMKKIGLLFLTSVFTLNTAFAQWSSDSLTQNAYGLHTAQVANRAVFSDGIQWNIYDFNSKQWTSDQLPLTSSAAQIAATNNKVYIAGGVIGSYADPVVVNYVNIYDYNTQIWSKKTKLSQARRVGAATSIGDKVLFAGGK